MGTGSTAPVCRTDCHGCQEVQPETIVSHGNKSTPRFHSCPLMPCTLYYFSCQLTQSLSRSASLCCSHELCIYNTSVRSSRCFKIDLYFACQGDAENTYKAIFCSSAKVLPDLTLASPQHNTLGDMYIYGVPRDSKWWNCAVNTFPLLVALTQSYTVEVYSISVEEYREFHSNTCLKSVS